MRTIKSSIWPQKKYSSLFSQFRLFVYLKRFFFVAFAMQTTVLYQIFRTLEANKPITDISNLKLRIEWIVSTTIIWRIEKLRTSFISKGSSGVFSIFWVKKFHFHHSGVENSIFTRMKLKPENWLKKCVTILLLI